MLFSKQLMLFMETCRAYQFKYKMKMEPILICLIIMCRYAIAIQQMKTNILY